MKNNILILLFAIVGCSLFTSCGEESLSSNSVIVEFNNTQNELDIWLEAKYMVPYNIDYQYRYNDSIIDTEKVLTPTEYSEAILMAKLTLYLTMYSYDELTGSTEFMRTYYPKLIQLIGCPSYNEDGTYLLGQAEGGKAIFLYGINSLSSYYNIQDIDGLNDQYFKTMHHEFTHILHDTKPYPATFEAIASTLYVNDNCWTTYTTDEEANIAGFISRYAATDANEDFAELISTYVINTPEVWESFLTRAGDSGADLITQKLEIIRDYLSDSWNIDLDSLRDIVLRRSDEIWNLDYSLDLDEE